MKKFLFVVIALLSVICFNACSSSEDEVKNPTPESPETPGTPETPDTPQKPDTPDTPGSPDTPTPETGKTLVVYYSFTNNVHTIVTDLEKQIEADVVRVQPAEKGVDYAANNYAIGSAQIQAIRDNPDKASSYPAIDPVEIKFEDYNTVIIATPLWWSNMAAPMQAFLFNNSSHLSGKNIGLIVSSSSSGISAVEGDAKRLIPDGKFFASSLWIRSSQTSSCHSMIEKWLQENLLIK